MGEIKEYQMGDFIPGNSVLDGGRGKIVSERKNIIEILPLPESEDEQRKLVQDQIEYYHRKLKRTGVSVITGSNLLDNPVNKGRADPTKVYILEI